MILYIICFTWKLSIHNGIFITQDSNIIALKTTAIMSWCSSLFCAVCPTARFSFFVSPMTFSFRFLYHLFNLSLACLRNKLGPASSASKSCSQCYFLNVYLITRWRHAQLFSRYIDVLRQLLHTSQIIHVLSDMMGMTGHQMPVEIPVFSDKRIFPRVVYRLLFIYVLICV